MASALPASSTTSTAVTNNDNHDLTTLRHRRASIPISLTIQIPSPVDQALQSQNPPPRPPRSPRRLKIHPKLLSAASLQQVDQVEVLAEEQELPQNVYRFAPPVAYNQDRSQRHRRTSSSGSALLINVLKTRQSHHDGPSCHNKQHRRSLSSLSSLSSYSISSVRAAPSDTIRLGSRSIELEVNTAKSRPSTLPASTGYHPFPNPSLSSITPSLRREISRSLETLKKLEAHAEMHEDSVPHVRLIKPSLPPEAGSPGGRSVSEGSRPLGLAGQRLPGFTGTRPLSARRSSANLPDVQLPPAGRYTALLSPTTPTSSTILLRPAPQSPIDRPRSPPRMSRWSPEPSPREQRFAPAASLRSSRSHLEGPPLSPASVRGPMRPAPGPASKDLIEIPRFKKRDLNLGIVRRNNAGLDWERVAWVWLWIAWLAWALIGIFFDVNVLYMLIQCAQHPSASAGSGRNWTFASAVFGIALFLTIFGIWLGWEVGYEFWRRWRVPRPAIEPIYLSLPASLHLSLISFPHFSFFTHIRLSALSTPHALDVVPEACHMLAQTLAPTVMVLPRSALAIALLVAYSSQPPAPLVGTGIAGSMRDRDPKFFTATHPGQLTAYARGILIAFVTWTAFRVALLLGAWLGLWMFSGRPLAGIVGDQTCCFPGLRRRYNIGSKSVPRSLSRRPSYDPSIREVPEKSWRIEEDEIHWAWRERTRARIQDAFELCLVRKSPIPPSGFLSQSISWGAARWREEGSDSVRREGSRSQRSGTSPRHVRTPTERGLLEDDILGHGDLPREESPYPAKAIQTELGRSRPESGTLPIEIPRPANPSHSRDPSGTSLSMSKWPSGDALATGRTTPTVRPRDSTEENLRDETEAGPSHGPPMSDSSKRTPTPESSLGSKEQFFTPGVSFASKRSFLDSPFRAPSGSVRSKETMRAKSASHLPSEFGVNKRDSSQSNSSEAQDSVDDDSVGLLTGTSSSPHGSISTINGHQRNRSRSVSAGSRRPSESGSQASSQSSRARAVTNAALSRARSSSISLLQKSLAAAAAAAEGGNTVVKRVRSGTITSQSSLSSLAGYKRAGDGDDEDAVEPQSSGRIRHGSSSSGAREVLAPGFTLPPQRPSPQMLLHPGEDPNLLSFDELAARQHKVD